MLLYATIQKAETSMGRSLTTLERLWFSYTSEKSDYNISCHNLIFVFLGFSIGPLFYVFIELLFPNHVARYKIQPKVKLSVYDNLKCWFNVMKTLVLVVAPLQLAFQTTGIRTSLPLPSLMEIISQLVVYFLIEDYTNYWIHRFLHCKWVYENIHKVHHEYTAPIGIAAPYAHWVEMLLFAIPSTLGPAIVPGHMITIWLWVFLRQIETVETHSGYDFPWTFTKYIPFYGGAEYHDYHHYVGAQSQSNFASVFTYCDYIYGTDKGYRYQKRLLQQQQLKDGSKGDSRQNGGSYAYASDIINE